MPQSEFLADWDEAITIARRTGEPCWIAAYPTGIAWFPETAKRLNPHQKWTARTMHPAFMGGVPPKFDPARDS